MIACQYYHKPCKWTDTQLCLPKNEQDPINTIVAEQKVANTPATVSN